jgi:hypothetical protein
MNQVPVNIKVRFGSSVVKLSDHNSRATTKDGVEIYIKMRAASGAQPMATIPDGTLSKYMHCRPEIISCDWVPQ